MIEVFVETDVTSLELFLSRLPSEIVTGIDASVRRLKPIAQDNVDETGALDTGALRASLYASTPMGSDYLDAVSNAVQAYANNPTKWPEIRKVTGGQMDVDPEATPRNGFEGYLGVAASHGKAVEEGYVSFYGNDVPARPFLALTAQDGFPMVVNEIRRSLLRALR